MKKFKLLPTILIVFLCLIVSSCTNEKEYDLSSSSTPDSNPYSEESVFNPWSNEYYIREGEDFDPNKSYLGESSTEFYYMACKYNYSPMMRGLKVNSRTETPECWNSLRNGFSYDNLDIFAVESGSPNYVIEKYVVKEKKKLTESEVRNLGFFGKKEFEHTEVRYNNKTQCLSTEFFWTSSFTAETSFEAMTQYGMWDSLICFLDRGTKYIDEMHELSRGNHVSSVLWPAFTIYSDDCTEVVGVSVLMDNKRFRTYMKEDGYDQKITPEQYAHRIRFAQENDEYFGRAAFYFEPSEFQGPGLLDYFRLFGYPIDL